MALCHHGVCLGQKKFPSGCKSGPQGRKIRLFSMSIRNYYWGVSKFKKKQLLFWKRSASFSEKKRFLSQKKRFFSEKKEASIVLLFRFCFFFASFLISSNFYEWTILLCVRSPEGLKPIGWLPLRP